MNVTVVTPEGRAMPLNIPQSFTPLDLLQQLSSAEKFDPQAYFVGQVLHMNDMVADLPITPSTSLVLAIFETEVPFVVPVQSNGSHVFVPSIAGGPFIEISQFDTVEDLSQLILTSYNLPSRPHRLLVGLDPTVALGTKRLDSNLHVLPVRAPDVQDLICRVEPPMKKVKTAIVLTEPSALESDDEADSDEAAADDAGGDEEYIDSDVDEEPPTHIRCTAHLIGHSTNVHTACYSPDGLLGVSASGDGCICVWDLINYKRVHVIHEQLGSCNSIVFSPDSSVFAVSTRLRNVCLFDGQSFALLASLTDHTGEVFGIAFSNSGRYLLSVSIDGCFAVRDLWNIEPVYVCQPHSAGCFTVSCSPDDRQYATCSADKTAKIFDARTKALLATLEGHTGHIYSCFWNQSQDLFITASADRTVRLWSAETFQSLYVLPIPGYSFCAKFLRNERYIAVSYDRYIGIWELQRPSVRSPQYQLQAADSVKAHAGEIYWMGASPHHRHICTVSQDRCVNIFELPTAYVYQDDTPIPQYVEDERINWRQQYRLTEGRLRNRA